MLAISAYVVLYFYSSYDYPPLSPIYTLKGLILTPRVITDSKKNSLIRDFSLQKGTGDILKFILLSVSVNACYFSGSDWKESSVKLL